MTNTTTRTEEIARHLRWNEIEVWISRAKAMGCTDVADALFMERLDAAQSATETARLVERARAALLLAAFQTDREEGAEDGEEDGYAYA